MHWTDATKVTRACITLALIAAAASTAAPLAVGSAGEAQAALPRASLPGIWTSVANGDRVSDLLHEGDTVWSATQGGGVVRWNLTDGTYRQFLAPQGGLLDNDVRALLRDRNGSLWAATARGLARHMPEIDRWRAIPVDHSELLSASTTALAEAPDGTLWVGFEQRWDAGATRPDWDEPGDFVGGGLARFDPRTGAWDSVLRAETTDFYGETFATIPSDNVTALAVSSDGLLWVGTRPYHAWEMSRDQTTGHWLLRGGGLSATDGITWRQWLPIGSDEACLSHTVRGLAVDAAQRVWAATGGRGLQAFRDGLDTGTCDFAQGHSAYMPVRGTDPSQGIPDGDTWSVEVGRDGRVWIGAGGGFVASLDHKGTFEDPGRPWDTDDVWTSHGLDGRTGESDAVVSALAVTESGDEVLVGTKESDNLADGWGVKVRAPNGTWRTLATAGSGLPSNRVTSVAVSPGNGDVWFGTASRGVARWDGERWRHWPAFGRNAHAAALVSDAAAGDRRVHVDVAPSEIGRAFAGPVRLVRFGSDPTLYQILTSAGDAGGSRLEIKPPLVLPHLAGAAVYSVRQGPPSDAVTAIAIDADGRAWVGGRETVWLGQCATYPECWLDGGLSAFDGTEWTVYNNQNSAIPDQEIQAVTADDQGRVWVGTGHARQAEGDGLAMFDPRADAWTAHDARHGYRDGGVSAIALDPDTGRIWSANHAATICEPDGSGGCETKRVGGGVARWDGAAWSWWTKPGGAPLLAHGDEGEITALLFDAQRGGVWAGAWSDDAGGFHWNSGVGIQTTLSWCPRDCANERWESRAFAHDGPASALAVDASGRLWVGATRERRGVIPPSSGMRILAGDTWTGLDARQSPLPDDNVTALHAHGSAMWTGTFDRGAAVWRQMIPVDHAYLPVAGR